MLQVAPVGREIIDAWPVAESGLPVRVVNSVAAAGIVMVGQLRGQNDRRLLGLRSLGRISLGHVHSFYRICGQIEQGRQRFQNIQEVFSLFLDRPEMHVLQARYGFARSELSASRNAATLQEIGNAEQKTRERIRQVQDAALRRLQSRLAQLCLQPFLDFFAAFLDARGGVVACPDLEPLARDPLLGGHNICGVLLLLADLRIGALTFRNGCFATLREAVLAGIEAAARAVLEKQSKPVSLDDLTRALPEPARQGLGGRGRQAMACILDHGSGMAATNDGRYFLFAGGTHAFLVEVLRGIERPAHYRTIANAFNDHLKPLSRKGAGFMLDTLNACPQCVRVDRCIYDLKSV